MSIIIIIRHLWSSSKIVTIFPVLQEEVTITFTFRVYFLLVKPKICHMDRAPPGVHTEHLFLITVFIDHFDAILTSISHQWEPTSGFLIVFVHTAIGFTHTSLLKMIVIVLMCFSFEWHNWSNCYFPERNTDLSLMKAVKHCISVFNQITSQVFKICMKQQGS